MVRGLNTSAEPELGWLGEFAKGRFLDRFRVTHLSRPSTGTDFRRRFLSLLSFKFREFGSIMALSVIEAANTGAKTIDAGRGRGMFNILPRSVSFVLIMAVCRINIIGALDFILSFRSQTAPIVC